MYDAIIMQIRSNFGWIAVNIPVPVALPFAVLACIAIANGGWHSFRNLVIKAIDGGQLFWAALGMMASNCYEAFNGYQKHPELHEGIAWTIGVNVTLILFTTIFCHIQYDQVGPRPTGPANCHHYLGRHGCRNVPILCT